MIDGGEVVGDERFEREEQGVEDGHLDQERQTALRLAVVILFEEGTLGGHQTLRVAAILRLERFDLRLQLLHLAARLQLFAGEREEAEAEEDGEEDDGQREAVGDVVEQDQDVVDGLVKDRSERTGLSARISFPKDCPLRMPPLRQIYFYRTLVWRAGSFVRCSLSGVLSLMFSL